MNKRPIVIEFSGLPNSGKTTLLHNLISLCKKNHINAILVQECAELMPSTIPKKTSKHVAWNTLKHLMQSLELQAEESVDFIFMDRGFYDQFFWLSIIFKHDYPRESQIFSDFMKKFDTIFHSRPDYFYVIDVSVEESMRRRIALGTPITFSNEDFLSSYKKNFDEFCKSIPHFYLDTTNLSESDAVKIVFNKIISLSKQ